MGRGVGLHAWMGYEACGYDWDGDLLLFWFGFGITALSPYGHFGLRGCFQGISFVLGDTYNFRSYNTNIVFLHVLFFHPCCG
jgi:hypothetical protein